MTYNVFGGMLNLNQSISEMVPFMTQIGVVHFSFNNRGLTVLRWDLRSFSTSLNFQVSTQKKQAREKLEKGKE